MRMMKVVLFFLVFTGFTNLASAQYKGQQRIYYANEYAINAGFFGMNFTGEYFAFDNVSIVPSYSIFLPKKGKASGVDVNIRYYFTEEKLQFYGLAGYGYYTRKFEAIPNERLNFNSINIGAGGIIKLSDELGINPEIRYQTDRNDFLLKLGVVYFIN
ncbi:hypothetical protein P872_08940 [Rhodonellum psychrophilum GCM71 = DSM 17998]|uniref:Outer membrane protein beta-barrel domain-containing protein n=2 Tax=Rhodonellum TaxID=336827 RepID=U5C136_9BACT|nr:hypothetical protein P872_08940 [Rhodonellum psychrophilum GCM71 = DSM 17998]